MEGEGNQSFRGKLGISRRLEMLDHYKVVSTLGEGAFGKCFLVKSASSPQLRVIKQIDLNPLSHSERNEALREAKILEKLHHPNIIRFHEVYRTRKNKLCIVMEHADGGDLAARIQGRSASLGEAAVLDYFVQICLAVKHIHDRKIVHRDLKSQNIFLKTTGEVKIGDFGIAKMMSHTSDQARSIVGTPYYISPEIVQNQPYSFKSDIWALGVLLYEMCALRLPFQALSIHALAVMIMKGEYEPLPAGFSQEMQTLLNKLLTLDPIQRPSISEVLSMPILEQRIRKFLDEDTFLREFVQTRRSNELLQTTNAGLETSRDSGFLASDLSFSQPSSEPSSASIPSLEDLPPRKSVHHSDQSVPIEDQSEEQQRALRRLELKAQLLDMQQVFKPHCEESTLPIPSSAPAPGEPSAITPPQAKDPFFPDSGRAEAMRAFLEEEMGAALFPAYAIIKEIEETASGSGIEVYYQRLKGVVRTEEMEQRVLQILVLLELEK